MKRISRLPSFNGEASWLQSWTHKVIALCVLCFLVPLFDSTGTVYAWLTFSNVPRQFLAVAGAFSEIRTGQIWRVVSPIFLHAGPLHLLFNMYWLHQLGHVVEHKIGGKPYLLSLLWISVLSNVGFYLWIGPHFVGMSGVIYGMVGFLWAYQKFSPRESQEFDPGTLQFFLLWYMACWLLSAAKILHVANSIHGVGLLAGVLFALGLVAGQLRRSGFQVLRREPLSTWGILLALVAGGLLTDFWVY